MPIFLSHEKSTDKVWNMLILEYKVAKLFDNDRTMVYSTTWMDIKKVEEALEWVEKSSDNKAVFLGLADPCFINFPKHDRIFYFGTSHFIFFLLAVDKFFLPYTLEQLLPNKRFQNKFLCYQRKVSEPRSNLYQHLTDCQGLITLSGHDQFKEINQKVIDQVGLYEKIPDSQISEEKMMPFDIWSLGNLDIWKSSFLNIVSETIQPCPNDTPFISEKTFKPIIGLRPFLIYGPQSINKLLKDRGFETFEEDFHYKNSESYNQQSKSLVSIVKDINKSELLYKKLYSKILHNRENFRSIAQNEWFRFNRLMNL
jgi:hypothetical protein